MPQSLLAAGQAVEKPVPLRIVAVPPAEAHPGRQLQLDVVGFFGPCPQELEATIGVEEDGVSVLIVVGYDRLEGVELPKGEQDRRTSRRGRIPAEDQDREGDRGCDSHLPTHSSAHKHPKRTLCRPAHNSWGRTGAGAARAWPNPCATCGENAQHPPRESVTQPDHPLSAASVQECPLELSHREVTTPSHAQEHPRPCNPRTGLACCSPGTPRSHPAPHTSKPHSIPSAPEENLHFPASLLRTILAWFPQEKTCTCSRLPHTHTSRYRHAGCLPCQPCEPWDRASPERGCVGERDRCDNPRTGRLRSEHNPYEPAENPHEHHGHLECGETNACGIWASPPPPPHRFCSPNK